MVVLSLISIHLVAWVSITSIQVLGVVLGAISTGFGELTFLAMASFYNKDVQIGWGSGTGFAGIAGSFTYLALTAWFNLNNQWTMLIISPLPLLLIISSFMILSGNHYANGFCAGHRKPKVFDGNSPTKSNLTLSKRILYVPHLLKYALPLFLVYLSEYMINQGVTPALKYPNSGISPKDSYATYQFLYQIGVFFSRSSIRWFKIKSI